MNETQTPPHAYCFLDTNVLIHFQTFDEVDWPSVLGFGSITLVLAPVVLKELDTIKADSSRAWRQQRTRTLISKLRLMRQQRSSGGSIPVRDSVDLFLAVNEPQDDWIGRGLRPDWMDDRLVATILDFQAQHPGAHVLFVSDDLGPQVKAEARQIRVVEAEGNLTRLEQNTPQDEELKKLRAEVQSYLNRQPNLQFVMVQDGAEVREMSVDLAPRCTTWSDDAELAMKVEEERAYVQDVIARAPAMLARPLSVAERLGNMYSQRGSLTEYGRRAEKYLRYLPSALAAKRAFDCGAKVDLAFKIQNDGTVPAEDVRIELTFPDNSFAINPDEESKDFASIDEGLTMMSGQLGVESSPREPWEPHISPMLGLRPPAVGSPPPRPYGPLVWGPSWHVVIYTHPKLVQKAQWLLPPVRIYLRPSHSSGVQVKYKIRADNLPNPIEKQFALRDSRTS